MVRVYVKRGNPSYKEKKLIRKLELAIENKIRQNPEFEGEYKPATNFQELQEQYDTYCIEDVQHEEVNESVNTSEDEKPKIDEHKEFVKGMEETVQPSNEEVNQVIDPFNEEEPLIRDYVKESGLKDEAENKEQPKTTFEEPQTFGESFKMPDDVGEDDKKGSGKKAKAQKEEPLNPDFDSMTSARKGRSTKKFAKYIVEAVCMLAEKGFVWYTTKDITDAKIAEYELSGEIPLDILLNMDGGQEATVKDFFRGMCVNAQQLSKFEEEEKNDLAAALAEVLMKKGFAPTAEQELAMIALKMFGQKLLIAIGMKKQINDVLTQLRAIGAPKAPQQSNNVVEQAIKHEDLTKDESAEAVGNPAVSTEVAVVE